MKYLSSSAFDITLRTCWNNLCKRKLTNAIPGVIKTHFTSTSVPHAIPLPQTIYQNYNITKSLPYSPQLKRNAFPIT